jgi:hypothetical protein
MMPQTSIFLQNMNTWPNQIKKISEDLTWFAESKKNEVG